MNVTSTLVSERDRALLGGDYASYHTQTTRRIRTLRKRLGVTTPRGRKYAAKSPVTAADVGQNIEWAYLLLASAERAWADAMSMKSKQSPENTQKPMAGSTKRQIISRFRRAIAYATNLVSVLSDNTVSKASSLDLLEAKAYLALLKGGLDFERNRWTSCIQNYSFARVVYSAIGNSTKQDIYRDLLTDTVDPSIRYAAYQENLPRTKAILDISIDKFPSAEAASRKHILEVDSHAFETTSDKVTVQAEGVQDLPSNIQWRGRTVRLEDAAISQALGLAAARESTLSEKYESFNQGYIDTRDLAVAYDDIITARQDAADASKEAIDELVAEGVEQSDSRIQSLQITRTAVNYGVIEWRVGRNRMLCGPEDGVAVQLKEMAHFTTTSQENGLPKAVKKESSGRQLSKLRERVALYDSILQNLDAIKQLPGVVADVDFVRDVDAKYAYFRALKCLAIGRSHAVDGQTRNALALYAQASDLVKQSTSRIATSASSSEGPAKLNVSSTQLQNLQKLLTSSVLQYRALTELNSLRESKSPQSRIYAPPLLEKLHTGQYEDDLDLKNIVNYPPKLRAIPLQPLFFDLAWNYIQYPGREDEATAATPAVSVSEERKDDQPKKRGWFGFGRS